MMEIDKILKMIIKTLFIIAQFNETVCTIATNFEN